jgi:hypothetical protein
MCTCCADSPNAATGRPSPASLYPLTPATTSTDPSGSPTSAFTAVRRGNTAAGTTWHGCNSICVATQTWMNRPTRSADHNPHCGGVCVASLKNRKSVGPSALNRTMVVFVDDAVHRPTSYPLRETETPRDKLRAPPCPQSDSNRHLADFKSGASADWAMGASDECSASTSKTDGDPVTQSKQQVRKSRVLKVPTPR